MCRAVSVVRSGDTGYLRASKYFSVPRGTLERYAKDTSRSPEELVHVHLEVLQSHGNKILWTETTGHKMHGFSVGNKKWSETSNEEKSAAGNKWLRSFSKRHPLLSIRTPERNICSSGESLYIKKARFFLTSKNLN